MEIKKKEQDFKINRKLLEKNKQTESSIKARLRSISGSGFSQESTLDISGTVHETSISKEELKNFKIKRDELDCQIKVGNEKMHESSMLVGDLRKRRLELIEQKKNLWNRESEITNRLTALKLKLSGTEKKWCRVMSREVLSGIKSLHTITAEHKIKGVFGAVYENLDVDARYFTCIDVTAGNKLFNVLVDASETATRILKIFKEKKFDGQITFIPINNLNVRPRSFPEHESAVPLISRIKYDSKFEKAFQLIFGQTMLCRNKQVAYEIAKEQSFDGVTLEGDQVFHRGSIVGGYVDARSGVLESYHQFSQLKTQLESHENELKMILGKVDEINDEITKISTKIINEESKYNQLKFDHQARIDQLNDCNKEITQMENFSRKIELSGISFNESAQSKENIDPNISHLSAVELEDKLRNAIFDQSKIIDKINSIEALLNNNFYITQNELKNKLCELEIVDSNPLITAKTNELAKYQSSIDEYNATVNEIQSSLHLLRGEIIEHENLREQDKIHLNSENTEHLRILSQLDGITNKISLARKKLNETENHMAIIAASEEDLSELRDKSTKWLWKNFNLIEAQLKKSTVNKKAAEDYVNLSSERDKSLRNYNELEKSLDVSYHFTNIFSQLYPNAYAHLILRRSSTQVHDPDQENDITSFSGVGIKVSFDKEKQNVVEISKLSGGEKTLVTLALIFAFQRCDPVPIYLFDEVDQALDANHRQTFSKMLHELSANGQFIVTTFRPEILTYSPKCFIVTFKNRVSAISQATAEKARSKIEAEKDENKT
ncbi:Structural maintenance of chromosomes protein 3 [Thelohanellus kitauei]|uniref:Structural maintenance of chromosomes protein 3 n=1 Tax=Thelohanellus kitauei TaxID=669202 RepID=A0A0C2MSN8_THEKT|nr:Structural maintenance of chromosomes protein 3 [Thelohanellus kitauei]